MAARLKPRSFKATKTKQKNNSGSAPHYPIRHSGTILIAGDAFVLQDPDDDTPIVRLTF
jgi:hypothetical protein